MDPLLSSVPPATSSTLAIEDERFAYRALRAMKMATATKLAIADEESHLLSRIREEEFILEMLHEEAELAGSRKSRAIYQLDAIREGVETFGVRLPSDEELEATVRQPPPGIPQSPRTPTATPPHEIYGELLTDMMTLRSKSTVSSTTSNSDSIGSLSHLSPFSLISSNRLPSPPPPHSLPLEAPSCLPEPNPHE